MTLNKFGIIESIEIEYGLEAIMGLEDLVFDAALFRHFGHNCVLFSITGKLALIIVIKITTRV